MGLRFEILSQPRGTQADLVRKTGLSKQTVLRALHGVRCGVKAAKAIAGAYGTPSRWYELIPAHDAELPRSA